VRTVRAALEDDDVACRQRALARRVAERRLAREDDQPLLLDLCQWYGKVRWPGASS
jgi:hypothetical protein